MSAQYIDGSTGGVMIHGKFGLFVVILVAYGIAGLISMGLDRLWKRSLWRDVAINVCCLYVVLCWVLP